MRPRLLLPALVLGMLAAVGLAACGQEEKTHVVEGEPLELGELGYNVALTRFLNPEDVEDSEYLAGQPEPSPDESYLGVFLTIENHGDEPAQSAGEYAVRDTTGRHYEPVESESPYALEVGATVPPGGELPLADSTAASGPIQGAMLLFLVEDSVSENRPLELEVSSPDGEGVVELDI